MNNKFIRLYSAILIIIYSLLIPIHTMEGPQNDISPDWDEDINPCNLCHYDMGKHPFHHQRLHQTYKKGFTYLAKYNYKMIPDYEGFFHCPICRSVKYKYGSHFLQHIEKVHTQNSKASYISSSSKSIQKKEMKFIPVEVSSLHSLKPPTKNSSYLEFLDEIYQNNIPKKGIRFSSIDAFTTETHQSKPYESNQELHELNPELDINESIKVCDICFLNIDDLFAHQQLHEIYEKEYEYLIKLNYKMIPDSDGYFECPTCNQKFKFPLILLMHVEEQHILIL